MDPNTTLAELRRAVIQLGRLNTLDAPDDVYHATNAVLERWSALDTWISNGGFFPSQWLEAQRTALENTRSGHVAPPAQRTRCEQPTLAGTTVPVPCPPERHDPLEEALGALEPDASRQRGPRFAGSLTAAEVLGTVRGDD